MSQFCNMPKQNKGLIYKKYFQHCTMEHSFLTSISSTSGHNLAANDKLLTIIGQSESHVKGATTNATTVTMKQC